MTKSKHLKSSLNWWLVAILILGFFAGSLVAEIQNADFEFIIKPLEITPSDMLDAEQMVHQVKVREALSDTLWQYIHTKTDSEIAIILTDRIFTQKVAEGLELLSVDMERLPRVRQIQRHLDELKLDHVQYVIHDLYEMAIFQLFKAKEKNPYQPYAKIATFQKMLNTLIKRQRPFAEVSSFIEKCKNIPWLIREKNELYILNGNAFQYFEQWEDAFRAYQMAYEVVQETVFPAGIDSKFAIKMDSIASKAFIAPERKLMADMLLKQADEIEVVHDSLRFYHAYFSDSTNIDYFTLTDSLLARRIVDQAVDIIDAENRFARKKLRKLKSRISSLYRSDLEFAIHQVFQQLENLMLEAKKINPFDQNLRIHLGRDIYYQTAHLYGDSTLFARSVREFENLIWIKKGNFAYFLYLGDAYMGVKNFQKAFDNYLQAEKTLIQVSILASDDPSRYVAHPDSAPVNYEFLSHCYSRQAEAKIKLFEGKEALVLLKQAFNYTADPGRKARLQNLIDLVDWDDGNILAMNLRKSANTYMKLGDYKSAKSVSLRLLDVLWTDRTKNEINNQIALLDFQHLNKKEDGIERMRKIIEPMKKDSVDGAIDPVNQAYFQNYGRMCFDFGLRYLEQEADRKIAYIYFFQATQLKWYGRPKAYLQLAALSEFDPRETIQLGFTALKEAEHLTPSEKRQVAELLSNAFQKEAKFKEARTWYRLSLDRAWCENREQS